MTINNLRILIGIQKWCY